MSLKQAIEQQLGTPVRIRMGGPGALDIFLNGERVYSKKETGRMPSPDEAVQLLRAKLAGPASHV